MLLLSRVPMYIFQFSAVISLAAALGVKTTMASEDFKNTQTITSQAENSPPVDKKKDSRRRSECGVPPSLWTLNLCDTHKFCYPVPEEVNLWQPQHKRARGTKRLLIKNIQTQQKVELTWKASEETIGWPLETMPIDSENGYLIQLKKRRIYFEREIYLYQVPEHLTTSVEKMAWMTQQGCTWQVEMLKKEQE